MSVGLHNLDSTLFQRFEFETFKLEFQVLTGVFDKYFSFHNSEWMEVITMVVFFYLGIITLLLLFIWIIFVC